MVELYASPPVETKLSPVETILSAGEGSGLRECSQAIADAYSLGWD